MTEQDSDENRTQVDPDEFETFDKYDPNLSPPEVPDDDEDEDEDEETPTFGRSVPAAAVEATVGVLAAAYNER
jgi:hypothetical protein